MGKASHIVGVCVGWVLVLILVLWAADVFLPGNRGADEMNHVLDSGHLLHQEVVVMDVLSLRTDSS
jgi:hypothetical protein